ncbi:MAG: hypothetical protein CMD18_07125 [Flavobacteriales bacterium]|nr:hypothetical protein [Flavobacteriales bacterium]|tara:strand:+ start:866 stop:1195 length:330 start_codon:yes stop_codon:yes gene_type:complete
MILFGRNDKLLLTQELPDELCESCGKKGGVVSIFQIYYHIIKIPLIPLSKKAASQCYSCRKVKVKRDFSEEQNRVAKFLKKESKTPLWTITGACFLLIYMIVSKLFDIV